MKILIRVRQTALQIAQMTSQKMLQCHSPAHSGSLAVVMHGRCLMTLPTPWAKKSGGLLSYATPRAALKMTLGPATYDYCPTSPAMKYLIFFFSIKLE